ncbi:zinc-binding protein A33-like [Protopterus annectens]|uniref:zinc-binding protein A33-like n=1 Tax=Protopterus annectens TaxID=7888 RepID=UPI001CFB3816|nr:zinc-binding protein A33-like [Protopterus annectens]
MASRNQADEDDLQDLMCSICKELFQGPVTLDCGHNFCLSCITHSWDTENIARCPECRKEFPFRKYAVNRALGNLAEKARRVSQSYKPETTSTFCEEHQEKLKLFCKEEKTPICVVCRDSLKHAGHSFITLQEAVKMYKDKLKIASSPLESQLKEFRQLQNQQKQKISVIQRKTQILEQHIASEFAKLHQFISNKENQLIQQLKEEAAGIVREMEINMKEIRQTISTLERRISAVHSKVQQDDPLHFLTEIKDQTEKFTEWQRCSSANKVTVKSLDLSLRPCSYLIQHDNGKEIKIISTVLSSLKLDPDTAHPELIVSEDQASVRHSGKKQQLPDNPARFTKYLYVMASEGFTSGKYCWEVGVSNKTAWCLGVATESCNRKGNIYAQPLNGFWTLWLQNNEYFACETSYVVLNICGNPQKIRVFLEYEEGKVSFYDADNLLPIYTFTSTFTEKLYPIFNPLRQTDGKNAYPMKLCQQKL